MVLRGYSSSALRSHSWHSGMPGIEPGLTMCKANALPVVLCSGSLVLISKLMAGISAETYMLSPILFAISPNFLM